MHTLPPPQTPEVPDDTHKLPDAPAEEQPLLNDTLPLEALDADEPSATLPPTPLHTEAEPPDTHTLLPLTLRSPPQPDCNDTLLAPPPAHTLASPPLHRETAPLPAPVLEDPDENDTSPLTPSLAATSAEHMRTLPLALAPTPLPLLTTTLPPTQPLPPETRTSPPSPPALLPAHKLKSPPPTQPLPPLTVALPPPVPANNDTEPDSPHDDAPDCKHIEPESPPPIASPLATHTSPLTTASELPSDT